MNQDVESVLNELLFSGGKGRGLAGVDVAEQFNGSAGEEADTIRSSNAAFLILLAGVGHPDAGDAKAYLDGCGDAYAAFLRKALKLIEDETAGRVESSDDFRVRLKQAAEFCSQNRPVEWSDETQKKVWSVFFPEGVGCMDHREKAISDLREKRKIKISQRNPEPLSNPAKELLFTSNILLTLPSSEESLVRASLPDELTERIRNVRNEKQLFWFDHPVQIGVETAKNEILYGLRGLDAACAFEKNRGNMAQNAKATCVLSASVTHDGLRDVAKPYLEAELAKIEPFDHLEVYVFSERDTDRLVDEVLIPAAQKYLPGSDAAGIRHVLGVDGEYGRHYSFLKAIAALWQVAVEPDVKATFKIDLDQVFAQKVLTETTGSSAFEQFMSPLWGATGTDSAGQDVELGMIAGALVNESDIDESLYKPDVLFPDRIPDGEGVFFASKLPMALSTAAEMGTRYKENDIDGKNVCIQRVHVTGGTNGILVDSLRTHRPFTPTFIGRAEDQAYLLSVLYRREGASLRYVHRDGLIMRHDKHAFAGEAIQAAALGRVVGDLVRMMAFTTYADCLPWPKEKIKEAFDPFTGCFISRLPVTVVCLRLGVTIAGMFGNEQNEDAVALARMAVQRLQGLMFDSDIPAQYEYERRVWDIYYDLVDRIEADTDPHFRRAAAEIISACKA